ncbi:uncharacterized protein VTP21DRAFT_9906 [Calcarisporiella thermophila]|uniref:uncharacterized protein n=1 Tax=Calcarisporiella thermophila TaxID=911321 RepID=UPI0037435D6D
MDGISWNTDGNVEVHEAKLLDELSALEAANIRAVILSDERANAVIAQIDRAVEELDRMNDWLNLCRAELESMGEDIQKIESQNRGLQVETSNQIALISELESLLKSLSLSESVLTTLKQESLESSQGLSRLEDAAGALMRVLHNRFEDGLQDLKAVQERMQVYNGHSNQFCSRIFEFLQVMLAAQAESCVGIESGMGRKGKLRLRPHEQAENVLIRYKGLILWMKEMDPRRYSELQMLYSANMSKPYKSEVRELIELIKEKHLYRKGQNEELDYVFGAVSSVTNTKGVISPTSTVSPLRNLPSFRGGKGDEDGKMSPEEAFSHAITQIIPLMAREQNFFSDLFHLHPKSPRSYLDRNETSMGISFDWNSPGEPIKDVKVQKKLLEVMDALFGGVGGQLSNFAVYGLKYDNTQSIGMLSAVEFQRSKYNETAHKYINGILSDLQRQLMNIFGKFVDEQVRVIEETKVTSKKRKGILSFTRTFPLFCMRMEQALMFGGESAPRDIVDSAYEKIIKTMFDSIETIARESDLGSDDKEQLNAHIMMIENMHHFYTEMRGKKLRVLEPYVNYAKAAYDSHLNLYIKDVIRRPLGKLLEYFNGVENLLRTTAPSEIPFHVTFNKSALRKVLANSPGKEMKKSLEILYKRVDKHFSEEEGLLQVVWHGIQEEFIKQHERFTRLIQKCYPDTNATLEFSINDLLKYFSELAKSH